MTKHGDRRVRERVGIPRKAVTRAARKAFEDGLTRFDFSGPVRRYLDAVYYYNGQKPNNIRVWSQKVWIFSDHTLITVLDLPNKYKDRVNRMSRKETDSD